MPTAMFRLNRCRLYGLLAAAVLLLQQSVSLCEAQERRLIRVEEDWMALISETDAGTSSPQILNVISPRQSLSGNYGMVEINHSTWPTFRDGGIQLQSRRGDSLLAVSEQEFGETLRHDFDRLQYTVSLRSHFDRLVMQVSNVRSKTWGSQTLPDLWLALGSESQSLENYSPDFSASSSSVIVGAHRVATLCITEVRYIYSNGDVGTDTTTRFAQRFRDQTAEVSLGLYSNEPVN